MCCCFHYTAPCFLLLVCICTFLSLRVSIFHICIWKITYLPSFIFNFMFLFWISFLLSALAALCGQSWRCLCTTPCPRAFISWGQKFLLSRALGMKIHNPRPSPALNPLLGEINFTFCQNYNNRAQFSLLTCDAGILGESLCISNRRKILVYNSEFKRNFKSLVKLNGLEELFC